MPVDHPNMVRYFEPATCFATHTEAYRTGLQAGFKDGRWLDVADDDMLGTAQQASLYAG